jgi:hypothetical protein
MHFLKELFSNRTTKMATDSQHHRQYGPILYSENPWDRSLHTFIKQEALPTHTLLTFVKAINLVSVHILRLAAMSRICQGTAVQPPIRTMHSKRHTMEKERVVLLCTIDQPVHRIEHVLSGWHLARVTRVIREEHDVARSITVVFWENESL